jgi:electron transfer flavoprotein-quinone oxidoreductase
LAQKAGFRGELRPSEVALGAKEVLGMDPAKIEDRFSLEKGRGATMELFGGVTEGMLGYAFIYTNKDSLSLGVGCKLSDYQRKGIRPSDHLERVKRHPALRKLIEGSTTLEYSSHLIPEGGMKSMPPLAADGFLVAGDAAQMINPAYREGSNLAMTSGRLAGETVVEAKTKGDYSRQTLSAYVDKLKASYIWPDMNEVKDLEESIERSPGFLDFYPKLACELAHMRFSADGQPKKEHVWKAIGMLRKRGLLRIARDLWPLRKVAV